MKRVLVLVEGQTEERFVKDVLCPHLWPRGIDTIPKVVTTKRVKRGPDFKGGITDYQKAENDLRRLLNDTGVASVTTLIDYYGLPTDFPGVNSRPHGTPYDRARHVEEEWAGAINHARFHPYLMVHEFTAPEMRVLFRKGQLGTSGSVAWDFDHVGMIEAEAAAGADAELAAIEAGAQDFEPGEDAGTTLFLTDASDLDLVSRALPAQGFTVLSAKLGYKPKNPVDPASLSAADLEEVETFLAAIDANDDVQNVFVGLAG